MRAVGPTSAARAFTVLELLCVVAIIAILAAILLPAVSQAKGRAKRLACVAQLHQTGIAFSSFAHEHDGKFPMAVPASAGGSLEFAQPAYGTTNDSSSFHHFQPLADELRTPRIVVCPADTRVSATNFISLRNENVSYFVGLNSELNKPNSILAGDRNLTNDYSGIGTVVRLGPSAALRWTREMHIFKGNLLFADGRVEESNGPRVGATAVQVASTDLALPTLSPGQRTGRPYPAVTPNPPPIAVANQAGPTKLEPWTPREVRVTEAPRASAPASTANQVLPTAIVSTSVTSTSSNPSAWLLPKEQAPDPGFSLFPQSVALIPKALVRKSVWPLWLLLVLLLAGLLTRFKWLGNRD